MNPMALPDWVARKRHIEVLGRRMAYVEEGEGMPIVFQHGNPTSSYLWRNILPQLAGHGRCIALDLIGMGDSEKLPGAGPGRYGLAVHQQFFDAALAALGVTGPVVLVLHDWGSALGFDWARRHASAVHGIAYMEGLVRPITWDDWPESARGIFQAFRSDVGEDLILARNVFVEKVLPKSVLRPLSEDEMDAYRAPFIEPGEGRRVMLDWPRDLPIEGHPAATCATVDAYGAWLASSPVPKLFINAEPGMIMTGRTRDWLRKFPNQQEVTVKGLHFIQEDSPGEIAAALRGWLSALA